MKACYNCGEEKPRTDFYPHKTTKDRLQTQCKECQRAYKQSARGKSVMATYNRKRSATKKVYDKAYRQINAGRIRESRRPYFEQYRKENAPKIRAWMEAYYKTDHCKMVRKVAKANRRTREISVSDGTVNAKNLRALLIHQNYQCKCCPTTLFQHKGDTHLDHITPIKAGGKNTIFNVQFLCATCNLRKNDKVFVLFPQQSHTLFSLMI